MPLAKSPTSLLLNVRRRAPELVTPAKPTPHEFKQLSDLDTRYPPAGRVPVIFFYPPNPLMSRVDPVEVIRKALAQVLVFYYPLAGRIREDPSSRPIIECNGEGVLFVEADADVTLDQFGYPLAPPFECLNQLLFDVPVSTDNPLHIFQVTRLKCGGFILGIRSSHAICDGFGLHQFMNEIGEIARGATSPSVIPVWERHLLNFNHLQQFIPQLKKQIAQIDSDPNSVIQSDLCYRTFFFEKNDISVLQRQIPRHFHRCSSFEILSSCVWKCRVVALQPRPTDEMSLIWLVNLRNSRHECSLPAGYYGNATLVSEATSTAKEIIENPLTYILELMRNAKPKVGKGYARSATGINANMMSYKVTDLRYVGFDKVDFGWGKPLFGGPDRCFPGSSFLMPFQNKDGTNGVMLPMCLPKKEMERFEEELKKYVKRLDIQLKL